MEKRLEERYASHQTVNDAGASTRPLVHLSARPEPFLSLRRTFLSRRYTGITKRVPQKVLTSSRKVPNVSLKKCSLQAGKHPTVPSKSARLKPTTAGVFGPWLTGEGVDAAVDQQALHPTVMDPKLWMVVVKQGKAGRESTTTTPPMLNRRTPPPPPQRVCMRGG